MPLKYETRVTHYIDYFNWDVFIKKEFPKCPYEGIVCEEEMGNDTTWTTNVDGSDYEGKTEKYLNGETKDDKFNFISTGDILSYLVARGDLPPGNYNITISW
jgi:hypothetical protein